MNRICEPELMLEPIQARAYAEADFNGSDRAFTARILTLLATPAATQAERPPPRIVDLGCGPGNISFRLASALPEALLLGIDGAAAMLEAARARQALEPRRWPGLRFLQARLPLAPEALAGLSTPFRPPYDLLVSNSLLHHLHDPAVLWGAIQTLAAPGALVVVRDLRRPMTETAVRGLMQRHAARAPAVLRRDFSHSLRAAFRPREVADQLTAAGLSHFTVTELGDRHLEVVGRLA
jgi:trans-aconitate 2-methyltransferase